MPALPDRTVTIPASSTTSGAFGTGQATRGSFQLPAGMDGVAITIKVSNDGVTFTNCPVEGNEANPITTVSSNSYHLFQKVFNFKFFQLVSGSTETAARVINIFTRD